MITNALPQQWRAMWTCHSTDKFQMLHHKANATLKSSGCLVTEQTREYICPTKICIHFPDENIDNFGYKVLNIVIVFIKCSTIYLGKLT